LVGFIAGIPSARQANHRTAKAFDDNEENRTAEDTGLTN